jgi:hypothetical protein
MTTFSEVCRPQAASSEAQPRRNDPTSRLGGWAVDRGLHILCQYGVGLTFFYTKREL